MRVRHLTPPEFLVLACPERADNGYALPLCLRSRHWQDRKHNDLPNLLGHLPGGVPSKAQDS